MCYCSPTTLLKYQKVYPMKSKSVLYRDECIKLYTESGLTPEEASKILIRNLRAYPVNHTMYNLSLMIAESIIRTSFVRKYDNQGTYMLTVAPAKKEEAAKDIGYVPELDMDYARTLGKKKLDLYAEEFDINLNRSCTKANMLLQLEDILRQDMINENL